MARKKTKYQTNKTKKSYWTECFCHLHDSIRYHYKICGTSRVSNTSKPPKTLQRNLKSWKVNFYSIQMGTSMVFFASIPLKFSQIPRSVRPPIRPNQRLPLAFSDKFQHGFGRIRFFKAKPRRKLCIEAVLSEIPNQKQYPKIGAQSTGPIPRSHLIQVVETAAKTGAEVCFLSFLAQILES